MKVQWAMTYMSRDRAQKWVTRIYDWEMLPANTGVNYFIDWDDFRASFRKEFFPLHEEATATNTLEGTAYFQANRSVDDYRQLLPFNFRVWIHKSKNHSSEIPAWT